MNQSIIKVISTSLLLTVLLFTGCTKDTLVGPTGPIGPTGAIGPQGNANVQEYNFITTASSWTLSSTGVWQASYSSLTINLTDFVGAYMVTGSTPNVYTALNWQDPATAIYYTFSNTTESVIINVYTVPTTTTLANPGSKTFKFIVIPS